MKINSPEYRKIQIDQIGFLAMIVWCNLQVAYVSLNQCNITIVKTNIKMLHNTIHTSCACSLANMPHMNLLVDHQIEFLTLLQRNIWKRFVVMIGDFLVASEKHQQYSHIATLLRTNRKAQLAFPSKNNICQLSTLNYSIR